MYGGTCISCGYGGGRFSGNAGQFDSEGTQTAKSDRRSFPIWIIIFVIAILLVILPIALIAVFTSQVMNSVKNFESIAEVAPEPEASYDYAEDYEEDFDEYVPSPSDKYLEAIVSSTVRGLSYDIAWNDTYLYADDENNEAVFYCYYPFVIGSEADYVADINAAISQTAVSFVPKSLDDNDYGYLGGYVTYMSEEILSVVMLYYNEHAGNEEYHITALNFDMTTGKQLSMQDMLPEFEFVSEFRDTCEEQNGYYSAAVLESMTDDEIMKAIINPETGAAFYSPVGLDIGFNYPDGWLTVTLKFEVY